MTYTIERLWIRLLLLLGRGRVTLVDDSGPVQRLQVSGSGGEVHDQVPRLAEYGHSSNPPAGSDVVMVKLGGDHSRAVVVATGHQASRPTGLPLGASVLYDNAGAKVLANADGTLQISAATQIVLQVGGTTVAITTTGLSVNGKDFATHRHINVANGSGTSGVVA
jgi:phage baseplate assembly protein V